MAKRLFIRVLLIDLGFLDGLPLWQIKNEDGIDFVVPVKSNMIVTDDARAFLKQKANGKYVFAAERPGKGEKQTGHIKLIGIRGLTTYNQYGDEEHQQLAKRGIRSQYRSWHCAHLVIVFAGEFYAVFDIETLFILLLRRPLDICWRVDPDKVYRQ